MMNWKKRCARHPAIVLMVSAMSLCAAQNTSPDNAAVALLDAVRQAQRPRNRMKVRWTYETVTPHGAFLDRGQPIPAQPPRTEREYVAYLSGIRSRIEDRHRTFASPSDDEPYDDRQSVSVFDGTRQIKFTDRIKGQLTTPLGWQYLRDKNSPIIAEQLFCNLLPIHDAAAIARYDVTCTESNANGLYVLTAADPGGHKIYRLTIDSTKGFNVVKEECLNSERRKYYEIDITLKQHDEGVWFPAELARTEYSQRGKASVPYRVKVTEIDLDPEISDDLFRFRFPPGTKVWDDSLQMWFDVDGSSDAERMAAVGREFATPEGTSPQSETDQQAEPAGSQGDGDEHATSRKGTLPTEQTSIDHAVLLLVLAGVAVLVVAFVVISLRSRRTGK